MEQELITLGILFFFALVGGVLASRFKQPVLLGLLVVGAIIGPKALGIIKSADSLELMIEFGAILMLFVIGLEFDIPKLKKIGLKAIIIATLNSMILTFVGFSISLLLGFSVQVALFIGVILSFGSTVVIVKILENKGMMDRQEVPLLIAILIIEDILAVLIITFFSGMTDKSTGMMTNIETLIISMIILVVAYMAFIKFVKPLLNWILKSNGSDEVTTFMALALCAGFAYFAYLLKLSPAVGAFLAGSIVASLPSSKEFEKAMAPYNLLISSFFFIAIGTLIDFAIIKEYIMVILILVAAVMITKIIAFSTLVYLFANMKGDKMFFASIAMFSVGEFSLLVAKESSKFNTGIDLVSISAAIVAISALLMSILISYSNKLYTPTMENMPYKMRNNMEKISSYIKAISEQLDLDNKHNQILKKNLTGVCVGLLGSIMIIFGWKKLSEILINNTIGASLIMTGYVVTMMLIAISLFYTLYKCKNVVKSLGEILSNATNVRNQIQNRRIVLMAFSTIGILASILAFPFIMFMLGMHKIYLIIPGVLLILMIIQIRRISKATSENSTYYHTSSKKFEFNSKNINNGWKM
jgi:Kef-type K+ transport system membrane component KefB